MYNLLNLVEISVLFRVSLGVRLSAVILIMSKSLFAVLTYPIRVSLYTLFRMSHMLTISLRTSSRIFRPDKAMANKASQLFAQRLVLHALDPLFRGLD